MPTTYLSSSYGVISSLEGHRAVEFKLDDESASLRLYRWPSFRGVDSLLLYGLAGSFCWRPVVFEIGRFFDLNLGMATGTMLERNPPDLVPIQAHVRISQADVRFSYDWLQATAAVGASLLNPLGIVPIYVEGTGKRLNTDPSLAWVEVSLIIDTVYSDGHKASSISLRGKASRDWKELRTDTEPDVLLSPILDQFLKNYLYDVKQRIIEPTLRY